jgi:hypothetical protein
MGGTDDFDAILELVQILRTCTDNNLNTISIHTRTEYWGSDSELYYLVSKKASG